MTHKIRHFFNLGRKGEGGEERETALLFQRFETIFVLMTSRLSETYFFSAGNNRCKLLNRFLFWRKKRDFHSDEERTEQLREDYCRIKILTVVMGASS
jgi:hypothetical protein